MLRLVVCGGRSFTDGVLVARALARVEKKYGVGYEVVVGGCRGADELARQWAVAHGHPVRVFEADWAAYGRSAGPRRNRAMLSYCLSGGCAGVVALPGGRGTADCIRQAQSMGIGVWEV